MIISTSSALAVESSNRNILVTPHGSTTYSALENAVSAAELKINSEYYDALSLALQTGDTRLHSELSATMASRRRDAVTDIYSAYGFERVSQCETPVPTPASSDLTFTAEDVYYSTADKMYIYTVDWSWEWASWDEYWDIEDLAGVSMTNTNDYYILKSYAKTWHSNGEQSGYVDEFGNHDPSDSKITKRYEDASGVIYNVTDMAAYLSAPRATAHQGRITIMVKQKASSSGTPVNKFIASYEHNFKEFKLSFDAKINSVGFALNGAISIGYEKINSRWLRASGGAIIGN